MTPVKTQLPGEHVVLAALGIFWLALYFAVRFFLEANTGLDDRVRLALAFAPVPVFGIFLWKFIGSVRRADELERRIHLEALGLAFPLGILLLTTLGLVQRAVTLEFQDWSYNHVWHYFVLFYLLGLTVARKRYS